MAPMSHTKHGHGPRHNSYELWDLARKKQKSIDDTTWFCCSCKETFQSIAMNEMCSNGLCQHIRCDSCIVGAYRAKYGIVSSRSGPTTSSSSSRTTLGLSKETTEELARLDQLKAIYKATFDEAAKKHEQESFATASDSDSGKSTLERYLRELIRPTEFVFAWERSILPFLVELVPRFLGRGFAINITRDPRKKSAQTICFTSRIKPTRTRRMIIARHVLDLVPDSFYDNTSFQFCHGKVEFLQRGTDEKHLDDVCDAKNPYFYLLPMMGDSIGPSIEECAATLGPCLKFDDQCFWLANLHVFLKQLKSQAANAQKILVLHPGLLDKGACGHSIVKRKNNVKFGALHAYSGDNLTTTRPSSHPFWHMFPESTPHDVVTDWVLIDDLGHTEEKASGAQEPLLNTLRIPGAGSGDPHVTVTKLSPVLPEAKVHTTGRTSGHQYGQICEIPAYLDADVTRKTTKATREWYVEQPSWITDSEESWIEAGIGVPGDSGAPVIDSDNNSLYGQIWGRNKYWGPGPRVAYFTPMSDISDDIQEKCPELKSALDLPQCSSRERTILSELYCPECAHPEDNVTPHSSGDGSDEMSIMSISSDNDGSIDSANINELGNDSTDRNPPDLQPSDMIQSDSDELMSMDSGDAYRSFSPIDQEEFDELLDLLPASEDEVALQMALDPYLFYDNLNHNLGVNDETLSIDEDDTLEDDFPGRSFAHKKKVQYSVPREKFLGSWVMVHAKPKYAAKGPSKLASVRMMLPRKEERSLFDSVMKTAKLIRGLALS